MSFWLKALGHGVKALGYAAFSEDGEDETENATSVKERRPRIRKATPRKPTKQCCLAKVPRVRRDGSGD